MLNWQGWEVENFLGWGPNGQAPQPPVLPDFHPKPAGGTVGRRKKYIIQGKQYDLTPKELQQALSVVMRQERIKTLPKELRKPAAAIKKVASAPVEKPTYEAAPSFDAIWAGFLKQHQQEAAAMARSIADEMERERLAIAADDAEILELLRMIPDE